MSYSSVVLSDSPIRYYRLGESSGVNAIDAGSQLQNGTITSVTYGATGLLVADTDTAMTFDGSSSYITLPTTGLPTGSASWTMECWIQTPNPLPSGSNTVFLMMGQQLTGKAANLYLDASAGGKITVDSWNTNKISWSSLPGVGTTYHVVATYDGTTLSLYVNGSLANSTTATVNLGTGSPMDGAIGEASDGTLVNCFSGVIDEVAIYNTALSATRIAAHYTAGSVGGIGGDPTVYGSAVADATITTACDMATGTGGVEVAKTTTVGGGAGNYAEVTSKGLTVNAVAAIPTAPTGNGWVYTPGAGTFILGNWSAIIALSTVVGAVSAVFTLRFFRLPGGVLANAVSIGTIPLSTMTSASRVAYTFAPTSMASVTFTATDILYFELWFNDATGAFGDNPVVYLSTTSANGVVNDMQIVTANFVPFAAASMPKYIPRAFTGTRIMNVQPLYIPRAFTGTRIRSNIYPKYIMRAFTGTRIAGALGANIPGIGTLTATLSFPAALSVTLSGVGMLTPTLTANLDLGSVTLTGVGTLSGTFSLSTALTTTLSGVGTLTPTLSANVALSPVTLSGSSTLTGTFSLSTALAVTIPGVGTLTGTLSEATALTVTLAGIGTLTGTFSLATALTVTLSGVGTLTGTLSVSSGVSLAVTLSGVGTLTGTFSLSTALSTTLQGIGTLSGTMAANTALTDTLIGVGTLSGTTSLTTALAVTMTGVGTLNGTFSLATALSVTLSGVGTLTGTMSASGQVALIVTLSGVGTLSATLSANVALAPITLAGVGQLAATLSLSTALAVSMSGTSTLSGVFSLRCALSLTFAAHGILSGTLTIPALSFLSATCVTRDMLATARTRDMQATCVTRDEKAQASQRDMTAQGITRDMQTNANTRS
jgi:hypothetical protein